MTELIVGESDDPFDLLHGMPMGEGCEDRLLTVGEERLGIGEEGRLRDEELLPLDRQEPLADPFDRHPSPYPFHEE